MNSEKVCSYIDDLESLLVKFFKHKNSLITNDDTENIIGNINMNGDFYHGPLCILMSLTNVIEFLDWEYADDIESMLNTMNKFVTKKEIIKRNECRKKICLCMYEICCIDMIKVVFDYL